MESKRTANYALDVCEHSKLHPTAKFVVKHTQYKIKLPHRDKYVVSEYIAWYLNGIRYYSQKRIPVPPRWTHAVGVKKELPHFTLRD